MKHKTLRCTAETAALLLTVAMLAFLIAGLHTKFLPSEATAHSGALQE